MEAHLHKCPALESKSAQEPYYKLDYNVVQRKMQVEKTYSEKHIQSMYQVQDDGELFVALREKTKKKERTDYHTRLSTFDPHRLLEVSHKVTELYQQSPLVISDCIIREYGVDYHVPLEEGSGPTKVKHAIQHASLLHLLNSLDVLKKENLFLEYGSGKGHLSQLIQNWIQSAHILIDRAGGLQHKAVGSGVEGEKLLFKRLSIDIKDLYLDGLEALADHSGDNVAFSKHLCGPATDLTLKCIHQSKKMPSCIVIALCCHQKMAWEEYIGMF